MKQRIFILFALIFSFNSLSAQPKPKVKKAKAKKIELVYLYASNGGMMGYFSNGSVVGCPMCEFNKSNILAMYKKKATSTWDLKLPENFTSYEEDNSWVLVNYKWNKIAP